MADFSRNQTPGEVSEKWKWNSNFKLPGPGIGATLYMNESFSDISIRLIKGCTTWRFPAHSFILTSQSTVFSKMLNSEFKERVTREILLQDMNPEILRKFIRCMYTGDAVVGNWREAIKLLKVADKYDVQSLVQMCDKYLQEHIDLSNVCYIYSKASLYNLVELGNICLEVILTTACIVLRSQQFELLAKDSVIAVISSVRLNVDTEMSVVQAVLRWTITECCRQNKLLTDKNISEIMNQFEQYLSLGEITKDLLLTLPKFMHSFNKTIFHREDFCLNTNLLRYTKHIVFKVVSSCCLEYDFICFDFLRFLVDCPLFLIGVHLTSNFKNFNLFDDLCSSDLVKLVSENNFVVTDVFEMQFVKSPGTSLISKTSDHYSEIEILFDRPIHLQPNIQYKLSLYREKNRDPYRKGKSLKFPQIGVLPTKGQSGSVPFTILAGTFYGVSKLLYLATPV